MVFGFASPLPSSRPLVHRFVWPTAGVRVFNKAGTGLIEEIETLNSAGTGLIQGRFYIRPGALYKAGLISWHYAAL